jgi:hypothetical protein
MRRVWSFAGIAALVLSATAPAAYASTPSVNDTGEVRTLSVIPAAGRAEVIIGVDGDVEVQDFTLGTPPRVVRDVRGARLTMISDAVSGVPPQRAMLGTPRRSVRPECYRWNCPW